MASDGSMARGGRAGRAFETFARLAPCELLRQPVGWLAPLGFPWHPVGERRAFETFARLAPCELLRRPVDGS